MQGLTVVLAEEIGTAAVFCLGRNVCFTGDKPLDGTHHGFFVAPTKGRAVQGSSERHVTAVDWWRSTPDSVAGSRAALEDEDAVERLMRILEDLRQVRCVTAGSG